MQRRLAAIVIADVVGYSKLIRLDEAGIRARFQALAKELFTPLVASGGGRIIKTMGDAFLIEFPSAVEAVSFAVEVQREMPERENSVSAEQRIRFRIGVNLGDIIVEGDDIHGDGVNVAARLEPIARPGGICVSHKVYDEVRRKLDLEFSDGGMRELKNIDDPVQVFHLGGEPDESVAPHDSGPDQIKRAGNAKPLIFVQSFKTIGRGDDIEALAAGLGEVIISGLAAQTALAVTRESEEAGADFILGGGVRGSGSKIRANFTLHDQLKGTEVWAQRYDCTMEDLFDLEDEISSSVVSVVRVRLKVLEMEGLENADNATLSVPQLLSKAAGYFVRSPGHNDLAEEVLTLALEKNPKNSMAHAMMALCHYRIHEYSPIAVSAAERDFIQSHVDRALELEPNSFFALLMAAVIQDDFFGDYRTTLDFAEHALEVNPNFTQAQGTSGIAKCYLGDWQTGYDELCKAIEANKEDPHRFRHQRALALILTMDGRIEEAADVIRRLVGQVPDLCRNGLVSAGIYWQAGAKDNAKHCVAELLKRYPDLTKGNMRAIHFIDEEQKQKFMSALMAAGLPEV